MRIPEVDKSSADSEDYYDTEERENLTIMIRKKERICGHFKVRVADQYHPQRSLNKW